MQCPVTLSTVWENLRNPVTTPWNPRFMKSLLASFPFFKWSWNESTTSMCQEFTICTTRSCDTAEGQGLQNCHRKRMVSADSAAQSQLSFVIKRDGKHTLCGCSKVDYLDCEYYTNQSWMPANSDKPWKAWLLAFVYTLLRGGCRSMLHQESVYLQRHNDVYKVACSGELYFLQMSLHRNSNANSKLARFEAGFIFLSPDEDHRPELWLDIPAFVDYN